jgi:uncharacterized protein (TIGR02145 family)
MKTTEKQNLNSVYADVNGILLKRENECLKRGGEYFTWDEAMFLFNTGNAAVPPSVEEWKKMLESGSTWDEEKKGIWIGKNHGLKEETGFSTFLPAAGFRYIGNGQLLNPGVYGHYWSSSTYGAFSYYLYFNGTNVRPASYSSRAYGLSVRCIAEK